MKPRDNLALIKRSRMISNRALLRHQRPLNKIKMNTITKIDFSRITKKRLEVNRQEYKMKINALKK